MTAQVGDSFKYKQRQYNIVAISNPLEFSPQQYGITPEANCTACWAGYWCEYEISDKGIILESFYVNSKDDYYPEINGVLPLGKDKDFECMGHHYYKGVNIKMPYTGKIVVGKDFMNEYYIHMGYQRAWSYKELKELVFKDGVLIEVVDHSAVAAELRKQIKEDPEFWNKLHDNIPMFIDSSFDLSLATKAWWL